MHFQRDEFVATFLQHGDECLEVIGIDGIGVQQQDLFDIAAKQFD